MGQRPYPGLQTAASRGMCVTTGKAPGAFGRRGRGNMGMREGVLPRDKAGVKMALKMKKDVCEGCRQGFGKEGVKVVNGFRYCKNCADYTMKYQGMLFY